MTDLKNKRIAGIDFGMKRTGIAVCDELHITTTPLTTLNTESPDFFDNILKIFNEQRVKAVVVGMPYTMDGSKTDLIHEIENFIEIIKSKSGLNVYIIDESLTSSDAKNLMLTIGKKKSKRNEKGIVDKIASALILRAFLDTL